MKITHLKLNNFRNIEALEISPCPGVNIIYGDNAQGKTNLLEAIWLFTGAKSFRMAKDSEYLRFGEKRADLFLEFYGNGRPQTAEILFGGKKLCQLNEIGLESVSAMAGNFTGVVFSPVHLSLVKDGPEQRRRFLDLAIGQLMPRYILYISEYNRILAQRNALLKDALRHSALLDTLDIWDEHLARMGGAVASVRLRYVRRLKEKAGEVYRGISKDSEVLEIDYLPSWQEKAAGEMTKQEAAEHLLEALRKNRGADLTQGFTTVGPHRDDLMLAVDGAALRSYGSQGQQRSCVLALKLAECGILYESTGEHPVILLDDVMSELDSCRRDYLLNHLGGRQVFITCCDKGYFTNLQEGSTFRMQGGRLTPD